MRDFTLVIPTYNRPHHLRQLVYFLKSASVGWRLRLLVLDSSDDPEGARAVVSPHELVRFPPDTHPWAKFREGIDRVSTEFCALCADDDIALVDGIAACIELLQTTSAACVRGHMFSFKWEPAESEALYLAGDRWLPAVIDQATPLQRLAALFANYQAATYSVYRTAELSRIMNIALPMTSMLGHELLTTALAAVQGPLLTVPPLTHGRSMGGWVAPYIEWHPLEFYVNNLDGLAVEYACYRRLLQDVILEHPENPLTSDEVRRALDVIHLRYLLQNAPDDVLGFLVDRKASGAKPEGYLSPEAQQSLLRPSTPFQHEAMSDVVRDALAERLANYVRWRLVDA